MMQKSVLSGISQDSFVLVLIDEAQYARSLEDLIRSVEKTHTHICYICMSKPYTDVMEDLSAMGTETDKFFFIDGLSSHYKIPQPVQNCIFITSPSDLEQIRLAIIEAVEKHDCSTIIFDTITTMLIYQQTSSIVHFTNMLVSEKKQENAKKLFIVLKEGASGIHGAGDLEKDLELFADRKIDMTRNIKGREK
ncbi:MAG: hypothetical protein V1813_00915 [Candidatus Aenigmatarchaeota archaeon]